MTDTICDTRLARGRVEIRTGVGRRRRWTAQVKGRIVAETLNAGVAVAEIARRHDISSQHLFNWIRAAKEQFHRMGGLPWAAWCRFMARGPDAKLSLAFSEPRKLTNALGIVYGALTLRLSVLKGDGTHWRTVEHRRALQRRHSAIIDNQAQAPAENFVSAGSLGSR